MSNESVSNYRRDIDGLRAISVLIVVAFHAFPKWVPGGFIGVDVFFVISGFLITGIILHDVDSHTFSIATFYHRRVRRIFPALLVVLLSVLIAGWLLLGPEEYTQVGWHIFSSGLFFQNITLFREAGYFDVVADYKPLLHLWSLSVEEQFYLLYPLLVALGTRRGRLVPTIVVVALLSCGACLFQTHGRGEPWYSFFLPQYRFWELMAGSLVQLYTRSFGSLPYKHLSFCGLLMLTAGVASTSRVTPFPGVMTLLPVCGAMCILAGQPTSWFSSRILGARVMVAIGLISYPLYLIHWPMFSFARIITTHEPSALVKWLLVLGSCVSATITYFFVERPLRFGSSRAKNRWLEWRTLALVSGMSLSILAGYYVFASAGVPSRAVVSNLELYIKDRFKIGKDIEDKYKMSRCEREPLISRGALSPCFIYGSNSAAETIVVWGDSHAEAWASVFFEIARKRGARVILFHHAGCAPLLDVVRTDGQGSAIDCQNPERAQAIVETVQRLKPSHVFLIARWSLYTNGWYKGGELQLATHFLTTNPTSPADRTTSQEAVSRKLPETVYAMARVSPVTIVKTLPVLKADIDAVFLGRVSLVSPEDHHATEQVSDSIVAQVMKNAAPSLQPVTVMDPADLVCKGSNCAVAVNLTVVYKDDNHITPQGSLLYESEILGLLGQATTGTIRIPTQNRPTHTQ